MTTTHTMPTASAATDTINAYMDTIRSYGGYEETKRFHDPVDREEAITLYKALIVDTGWKMGRNHLQTCLHDSSFISFEFKRVNKHEVCITTYDFSPDC